MQEFRKALESGRRASTSLHLSASIFGRFARKEREVQQGINGKAPESAGNPAGSVSSASDAAAPLCFRTHRMKRFPPARIDGWEHLRDPDSAFGSVAVDTQW